MEREPNEIGFHLGDIWATPDNSKIIRFIDHPICDHLEVDVGEDYPLAYVMDETGFQTLEAYQWSTWTYQCASPELMEFIIELHLENQETELLQWYTQNP